MKIQEINGSTHERKQIFPLLKIHTDFIFFQLRNEEFLQKPHRSRSKVFNQIGEKKFHSVGQNLVLFANVI